MEDVNRFPNRLIETGGHFYWDIYELYRNIIEGLKIVAQRGDVEITSIGIDTWGVDFVCVGKDGDFIRQPYSYRDPHTVGASDIFFRKVPRKQVYEWTGIQVMNFNSLFQLDTLRRNDDSALAAADKLLFIPDALSYMLTGEMVTEYTIASTAQLINAKTRKFEDALLYEIGLTRSNFGRFVYPGDKVGVLTKEVQTMTGLGAIPVIAVAGHDTASAVASVPAVNRNFAYLSSGTWSLMGFESKTPCTSDAALRANITNEGGAEGRYRVLKNIMGLWLLQRVLKEQNVGDLPALIARTAALPACRFVIDCNDDRFINPDNMSAEIQAACREAGQPVPDTDAELARCIFDSLALLYARVLNELAALRGQPFSQLHIVGGGCQNELLNQLCADACGITVTAGPIEASTLGNIGIQLMTLDELHNVDEFRQVVRQNYALTTFTPNPESEIARFVAQFQPQQTKELCA